MIKLPETVTGTFFISLCRFTGEVILTSYEPSDNAMLGTTEVTVDVPQLTQVEINQNKINALQVQADELKAKTSERLKEISEQIQQLTCIEHKPESGDGESLPFDVEVAF